MNINSSIFIPMIKHGKLYGFISFGCVERKKWNDEYLQMLGFVGEVFVNALERQRTAIELQSNEIKYRRVFNEMHDIYYETTPAGIITTISPSVEKYLGYTPGELIGKSIRVLYKNTLDRKIFRTKLFKNGYINNFDIEMKTKDSTLIYVLMSIHIVYDKKGKPVLLVGSIRDVTDKKKIELALLTAKKYAEEANRTKSEFLANMSHELRTPLNSVIGFSDILIENIAGPLSEKQEHYVSNISNSGKHLLGLINDILDISKIEAGEADLKIDDFYIFQFDLHHS